MSAFGQRTLRRVFKQRNLSKFPRLQKRRASTHGEHEHEHNVKYDRLFLWSIPPAVAVLAYFTLVHETHHHHELVLTPESPPYPYLKIRTKPLPWGDGDTELFDMWRKKLGLPPIGAHGDDHH
eukprot:TRINITY_DN3083_c0_g1_i2.p1 TRINITY_DN3083_c0_g1~~TRINITY_DN3083_c0_g1_i2.p1  ORF type:complete len:123 (+),score=18.94 TRINITY_DN3083_c0_g1_i2:89-457(+)